MAKNEKTRPKVAIEAAQLLSIAETPPAARSGAVSALLPIADKPKKNIK